MRSLRKQTFATIVKGKTLRQVLDICQADQAKLDACFPTLQSVVDLLFEKMPEASIVLSRRYDLVSIEDYLELARALTEGRCNKYGMLVDAYGHTKYEAGIKPFYEIVAEDNDSIQKLIIDGHPPKSGTLCFLVGFIMSKENGDVSHDWYPFPVKASDLQSVSNEDMSNIMNELAVLLTTKIHKEKPQTIDVVHGEEFGDEDADEHHIVDPFGQPELIENALVPVLLAAGIARNFPRLEVRDDAGDSFTVWIEYDTRRF